MKTCKNHQIIQITHKNIVWCTKLSRSCGLWVLSGWSHDLWCQIPGCLQSKLTTLPRSHDSPGTDLALGSGPFSMVMKFGIRCRCEARPWEAWRTGVSISLEKWSCWSWSQGGVSGLGHPSVSQTPVPCPVLFLGQWGFCFQLLREHVTFSAYNLLMDLPIESIILTWACMPHSLTLTNSCPQGPEAWLPGPHDLLP